MFLPSLSDVHSERMKISVFPHFARLIELIKLPTRTNVSLVSSIKRWVHVLSSCNPLSLYIETRCQNPKLRLQFPTIPPGSFFPFIILFHRYCYLLPIQFTNVYELNANSILAARRLLRFVEKCQTNEINKSNRDRKIDRNIAPKWNVQSNFCQYRRKRMFFSVWYRIWRYLYLEKFTTCDESWLKYTKNISVRDMSKFVHK